MNEWRPLAAHYGGSTLEVKAWPLLTFQFHKAHFSPPCLSPILLSTSSYASQTEDTVLTYSATSSKGKKKSRWEWSKAPHKQRKMVLLGLCRALSWVQKGSGPGPLPLPGKLKAY